MKTNKIPNYLWAKIEVATQLREIMFQRYLTQTKWAENAEVAQSYLNNILSGKILPRFDSLINLADAAGCRVRIIIEPKTLNDNERFEDLAKAYWQCEFGKFTPEERKILLQHYMLSLKDECDENDDQLAA